MVLCFRRSGVVLFVFSLLYSLSLPVFADDCLSCHGSKDVMAGMGKEKLVVDEAMFKKSVHGKAGIDCLSCHTDASTSSNSGLAPHKVPLSKVDCNSCHQEVGEALKKSIHGEAGLSCTDCHGNAHEILPTRDMNSKTNPINQPKVCGVCHTEQSDTFRDNFHYKRLLIGNDKSASCGECHGAHDIIPKGQPGSLMNEGSRHKMCDKCHVGTNEKFAAGFSHKSLKQKGIPYYAAAGLGILTTFTFLFVMVHTILDIIALIRERLTGKSH